MKLALYKSTHSGISGIYNRVVRWWDQGVYSHCELLFSSGMSASSSYMDKGVRLKLITYAEDKWDFLDLSTFNEQVALDWFKEHKNESYNLIGNLRFGLGFLKSRKNTWFCSEAIGVALGIKEPWRLSPNGLAAFLNSLPK